MCAVILSCGIAHAGQPDFEAVGTRLIEAVQAGELTPEQAKAMMGALACVSFEERLNGSLGQRTEHEGEREEAQFIRLGLNEERFDTLHEYLKQSGLSDRQIELTLEGMLRIVHVMQEEGEDIELDAPILNF